MDAARKEEGAVLVEFALVLVPLLLIVAGFLQIGLAMNAKIDSTHLTAEGARYIAVNQNPGLTASPATTMQNYIRSRAGTAALKLATVCISYPSNPATGTSGMVGDPVQVTMTREYGLAASSHLAALKSLSLPLNVVVLSTATMRLEALPTNVPAGCVT
jgi:Flp pilus assembly protein TadG